MKYKVTGCTLFGCGIVRGVFAAIAEGGVIQCAVARVFFHDRRVLRIGFVAMVRQVVQGLRL